LPAGLGPWFFKLRVLLLTVIPNTVPLALKPGTR
jgi:hypothetical protein